MPFLAAILRAFAAAASPCVLASCCLAENPCWICETAVLMNVPGPYTTLAGLARAIFVQTRGRPASAFAGTLPARQPSSLIRSARSLVRVVRWRLPRTITITDSSPNCLRNRSVALKAAVLRPTRVSVDALGSSRSASAVPIRARAPTTATVAIGRRVTTRATRPKNPRAPPPRRPKGRLSTESAYPPHERHEPLSAAGVRAVGRTEPLVQRALLV